MKICVECQEDVSGKRAVRIKEDRIIRLIRAAKQKLNIAANNELYVCEKDIDKHVKRRKEFEKNMLFFSILAGVIVLLMLGTMLLSGRFDPWLIVSSLLIGIFILLFAVVFKYAPAVEDIVAHPVPGAKPEEPESSSSTLAKSNGDDKTSEIVKQNKDSGKAKKTASENASKKTMKKKSAKSSGSGKHGGSNG
jgi:F0F1-type ATP synthase assembly protein I